MSYVHRCIIVRSEKVELARNVCAQLAGPPGSGMFITALSPNGKLPATHFISCGLIEDTFIAALSQPSVLYAVCQSAGLELSLNECNAMLEAAYISDVSAAVAIDGLGLEIVLFSLEE